MAYLRSSKTGDVTRPWPPPSALSHRNIIINGAMQVSQRGTSFTGLGASSDFVLDRWKFTEEGTTDSRITISQNSTTPTGQGFGKALYLDVTTADASLDSGHIQYLRYAIEGQDVQQLAYGSANAKSMTLSFWVKSPKTGIHVVGLKGDSSTNNRMVSGTYTIVAADTFEKHSITFPGDASGTIANDNTAELELHFYLSAGTTKTSGTLSTTWIASVEANRATGQVNLMDNTSNDFYITGVQLELGSVATPFENRSYGDELARCLRYYEKSLSATRMWPIMEDSSSNGYRRGIVWFSKIMRDTPTITTVFSAGSGGAQNECSRSFTPYQNGVGGSSEVSLNSWTASAEI
jgi:hypothetical protein